MKKIIEIDFCFDLKKKVLKVYNCDTRSHNYYSFNKEYLTIFKNWFFAFCNCNNVFVDITRIRIVENVCKKYGVDFDLSLLNCFYLYA